MWSGGLIHGKTAAVNLFASCSDALKCFMTNIQVIVFIPELLGMETMFELGLAERGEGKGISAVAFIM